MALPACSIHSRARSALTATSASGGRSVCVLLFDGLPNDSFSELLAEGTLPNLKRWIVDRGLRVETAVASAPSETYPNLAAILTGLFPGHHGIPANVWLDRRLRRREAHTNIFRSYATADFLAPEAKTLYERLPNDTVTVTTPIFRGATVTAKNVVAIMASYLRNDWGFLDRKTLDDVGDAYRGAADTGKLPSLVFAHLLGPDEVAHSDGPDSPEFKRTLGVIDRSFGRLIRRLVRRKIEDRILFVVVGDHGNSSYRTAVDIEELVHRALFSEPAESDCRVDGCFVVPVTRGRARHFDIGDVEVAVGAYRGAMIWLPGNRPTEDIPTVFRTRKKKRPSASAAARGRPRPVVPSRYGFAAMLASSPEIGLVVTRGERPGEVYVYGPSGESVIDTEEGALGADLYAYRVIDGTDPLGYTTLSGVAERVGTPQSASWWLHATATSAYPDLVVQLSEFFDSPRSPDVYITPADGYGFRFGKSAGHGSLARREMVVPLVFAGPGVAPGRIDEARTVDLTPTILRYLRIPFDIEEMDGIDLAIEHPANIADRKIAP